MASQTSSKCGAIKKLILLQVGADLFNLCHYKNLFMIALRSERFVFSCDHTKQVI